MSESSSPVVTRRRNVCYDDAEAVIADIRRLQRGYTKTGNWTLAQACWHLNAALNFYMRPGPHPDPSPISDEMRQRLERIIATGEIPTGINAPERALPPVTANDGDVDALIATLERYKTFSGPFAPHPFFGRMETERARRHVLIHAAHHLSYLVPST